MLFVLVHVLISILELLTMCDQASQIGAALCETFRHHQALAVDPLMKLIKQFLVIRQQITHGDDRFTGPICELEDHTFWINCHVAHLIIQNIVRHRHQAGMLCSISYDLDCIRADDFYEKVLDVITSCGLAFHLLKWAIANVLKHLLGVVGVADLV